MSDFDYANARLRAMRSRLLSRRALEALADADSIRSLLLALADTAYQAAVQTVLAQTPASDVGAERLVEALRQDLLQTIGRVRSFFSGGELAEKLAALALRRYDVDNLQTILRGLAQQVPPAEILESTMPIGELRPAELALLARAPHVSAALDLLATWRLPLARPLLEQRAAAQERPVEVLALELALERWHVRSAIQEAQAANSDGVSLYRALRREADISNILTALRLAGAAERPRPDEDPYVGPGLVALPLVMAAAARPSIAESVNTLAPTPYGSALRAALPEYERSQRLSAFEIALARLEQRLRIQQAVDDVLGIGVLLAYLALKTNEVANLRTIAYGIALGTAPEEIGADLLVAA
jgi:V/A-type H+-transporting ATPase subunit C